jgi:hypothetical protein
VRFSDPARFSFAHGGKDGHSFPVPLKTCDETLGVLRRSLHAGKRGDSDRADGLRRLDKLVRSVEKSNDPAANFRPSDKTREVNFRLGRWSNGF